MAVGGLHRFAQHLGAGVMRWTMRFSIRSCISGATTSEHMRSSTGDRAADLGAVGGGAGQHRCLVDHLFRNIRRSVDESIRMSPAAASAITGVWPAGFMSTNSSRCIRAIRGQARSRPPSHRGEADICERKAEGELVQLPHDRPCYGRDGAGGRCQLAIRVNNSSIFGIGAKSSHSAICSMPLILGFPRLRYCLPQ